MKKIIHVLFIFLIVVILSGCNNTAVKTVEDYLNEYKYLSNNVTENMKEIVDRENIEGIDRETYIKIFEKQYKDLKYEILNEEYNGDEATIKVKINVYDLYKIQNDANIYLANHMEEFNDENGEYDYKKFIKYKLNKMINANDRVDYTIDFYVVNKDNRWTVSSLSNADLEKIHGIYNYLY